MQHLVADFVHNIWGYHDIMNPRTTPSHFISPEQFLATVDGNGMDSPSFVNSQFTRITEGSFLEMERVRGINKVRSAPPLLSSPTPFPSSTHSFDFFDCSINVRELVLCLF